MDCLTYAAATATAVTAHQPVEKKDLASRFWRGVKIIQFDCKVDASAQALVSNNICAQALAAAQHGAPISVGPIGPIGADAILSVRISQAGGKPVITAKLSRVLIADDAQGYIVSPPLQAERGMSLATIDRAFDRILPWRQTAQGRFKRAPSPPKSY